MNIGQRARLAWRVMTTRTGNLMAHAERELGPQMDVELRELLLVFGTQGHSGSSAEITAGLLALLLQYEPIGPLTGADDEWVEVAGGLWQNRRCGRVFKGGDRFGGQAYDIDGIVWERPGDPGRFTNRESCVPVTFPYTPQTTVLQWQPVPEVA